MSDWITICDINDIPPLGSRTYRADALDVAIIRAEGDKIFAVEDKCPHKQGPLSQGIVHGDKITCPLHNWVIELTTGEAVAPDVGCVKTFEVQTQGATILLKL